MQVTVQGLLNTGELHSPKGTRPTIRLALTPAGEFHRHDRAPGDGPYDR